MNLIDNNAILLVPVNDLRAAALEVMRDAVSKRVSELTDSLTAVQRDAQGYVEENRALRRVAQATKVLMDIVNAESMGDPVQAQRELEEAMKLAVAQGWVK